MRIVFLVAAIGLAAGMTGMDTWADDIYVNQDTGDDSFNGKPTYDSTANAGPVKTIARALQIAKQGDRIIIEKTLEPYHEGISLQGVRHSGTDYLPFTIISDGAVLDGTGAIDAGAWEHVDGNLFRFQPRLKSFQQLFLGDKPAERVLGETRTSVPDLAPLQWALANGWVYFCTEGNLIPSQYDLRCSMLQTGITLYEVHHVQIQGLTIQGFQLDGINAHDGVASTLVQNCRLRGNGRSGLSVGGASRVWLTASLAGANGDAQIRTEGYCRLAVQDCQILESENTGPAIDQAGGKISIDGNLRQTEVTAAKPLSRLP